MRSLLTLLAIAAIVATACSSPDAPSDQSPPLDDVPGGWKMISAGDEQTCGIAKPGFLYCWGKNDRGQLGDGTFDPRATPTRIQSDSAFDAVAAGTLSSCGVTTSGGAYCWGWVADQFQPAPVAMDPEHRYTTLAVGLWMTCGLTTEGSVRCWSQTVKDSYEVTVLPGGFHFQALANSYNFFCGVSTDRKVYCWTADTWGVPSTPELQAASSAPIRIAVGDLGYYTPAMTHLCTIDSGGATYCWGTNIDGQLGVGDYDDRDTPTLLVGREFVDVSASGTRTCGVGANGVPYCWGRRADSGSVIITDTAVALLPGVRAAAASVAPDHYCFLTEGGAAFCGGSNVDGQLGTGTSGEQMQPLRRVVDP